ncbi:MAG: polymer-forming cytoskeletal protein [Paracoccaceae bacterium]|nr:MAG: polymer-forming cytoskeletal protein [Paracoccaceae bacterium]
MTTQPPAPQTGAPLPPATRAPGRSVLSADLRIVGNLTAEGTVEVMGEVEGSIRARTLVITQEGRVTGTVAADTVEIRGRMDGGISTQGLMLRSPAQVTADVTYASLTIESGATVEGSFRKPKE